MNEKHHIFSYPLILSNFLIKKNNIKWSKDREKRRDKSFTTGSYLRDDLIQYSYFTVAKTETSLSLN